MTEQSDALDEAIQIMMQEPHLRVGRKIMIKAETTIYVLEAIRKALTEHAAIKRWQPIAEVKKSDEVDLWANNRRRTNCVWDEATSSWYTEYSEYVHEPTHFMNEPGPPCLSNPPQSDNQTVLTGEDDSQIDALEAENARLRDERDIYLTKINRFAAWKSGADGCNCARFHAQQALDTVDKMKGQLNDTE